MHRSLRRVSGVAKQVLRHSRPLVLGGIKNAPTFPASQARSSLLWGASYSTVASKSYPSHQVLGLPALSPTMEHGTLLKWEKKEGDFIKAGEVLADIETDKASVGFQAVEEGWVAKILVKEGTSDVPLGTPLIVVVDEKADIAAFADFTVAAKAAPTPAAPTPAAAPAKPVSAPAPAAEKPVEKPAAAPAKPTQAQPARGGGERVLASPFARKLAGERGVNVGEVHGTGPRGRVVANDVLSFTPSAASASASAPAKASAGAAAAAGGGTEAWEGFTDVPLTNVRKVIAQRLTQSKQTVPHYYISVDINMDKIMKLRQEFNARLEKDAGKDKSKAVKLSVNDFIVKASALACKKVPAVNSSWRDTVIRQFDYVDVSIAVGTDGGLITPIVKDADLKGLAGISTEVKELAGRARENKLQPHEFQGGTFTISNLGMYGVKNFSAIINPPQAAILAVGATEKRVIVNENDTAGNDPFKVAQVMSVTASFDHRVVDGAVGAQWLAVLKGYLEDPNTMLL